MNEEWLGGLSGGFQGLNNVLLQLIARKQREAEMQGRNEDRQFDRLGQMAGLRNQGIVPSSEATDTTFPVPNVTRGGEGTSVPLSVPSAGRYTPFGEAGGQSFVVDEFRTPQAMERNKVALEEIKQRSRRQNLTRAGVPEHMVGAALDNPSLADNILFPTERAPSQPRTLNTSSGIKQWDSETRSWVDTGMQAPAPTPRSAGTVIQGAEGGPVVVNPGTATARPVTTAGGAALQMKPPAGISGGYNANLQIVRQIDDAIAQLKANPSATGLRRAAPDFVNQRLDPEGVGARAGVGDVGSMKIHQRSGAAVSAKEEPRLMPFVPTTTGTADANIQKLERLKQFALQENEAMAKMYPALSGMGGTTGKALSAADAAKAREDPAFAAWLRAQGYEVP